MQECSKILTVEYVSKKCNVCHESKDIDAFYKDKGSKEGIRNQCRACRGIQRRKKYDPKKAKWESIKNRYGLTQKDWEVINDNQEGHCATCLTTDNLCVDHCHTSGKVRGLLCTPCNVTLGMAKDNPETLRKLADYLEK